MSGVKGGAEALLISLPLQPETQQNVVTERYFILDELTGKGTRYAASMQAYSDEQYQSLFEECSFRDVVFYPSFSGDTDKSQSDYTVLVSQKGDRLTPGSSTLGATGSVI